MRASARLSSSVSVMACRQADCCCLLPLASFSLVLLLSFSLFLPFLLIPISWCFTDKLLLFFQLHRGRIPDFFPFTLPDYFLLLSISFLLFFFSSFLLSFLSSSYSPYPSFLFLAIFSHSNEASFSFHGMQCLMPFLFIFLFIFISLFLLSSFSHIHRRSCPSFSAPWSYFCLYFLAYRLSHSPFFLLFMATRTSTIKLLHIVASGSFCRLFLLLFPFYLILSI